LGLSTTIRVSAGKGYRTPNLLSENFSLLASQRQLIISDNLNQEDAWNYGISLTFDLILFNREAELDVEAYRTEFISQVLADVERYPTAVLFYNLHGKSFANSYLLQLTCKPVKRFSVLAAFRLSDVKVAMNGELREKPMVNIYKGLLTLNYATKHEKWKFDFTLQFNGGMRLPDSQKMPVSLRRDSYSPSYIIMFTQVSRKFKWVEVYLGGENLSNYTQKDPITEFIAPYHTHFDTSMVWGPLVGATAYAGIRWQWK
jgi:hypothetical protein